MLLHAASAEACPPPRYRHCAPLIHIKFDTNVIISRMHFPVNDYQRKYMEKTGAELYRRLPAIFRTMPPMNFGSRMHTIRTRI